MGKNYLEQFFFILALCFSFTSSLYAKEIWSMNSASLLYGSHFEVPLTPTSTDKNRIVLTLEHASTNSWGDFFGFIDAERSTETQNNNLYGEITPRLSLSNLFGYETSKPAVIKDTLAALNIESGINPTGYNFVNFLVGPGLALKLPQFNYLNLNFFRRFNQRSVDSWQLTVAFGLPFKVSTQAFLIDSFWDWVTATSQLSSHLHGQFQIKWDIGQTMFKQADTFYVGTEYKYWKNKFGIQGVTESMWQLLAQVRF